MGPHQRNATLRVMFTVNTDAQCCVSRSAPLRRQCVMMWTCVSVRVVGGEGVTEAERSVVFYTRP